MTTYEWQWRQTTQIPDMVLLVAGRTEYTQVDWPKVVELAEPAYWRMLGDPNALGMAMQLDHEHHVAWSINAWAAYSNLEAFVRDQIEWLTHLTEEVMPSIRLRHNAYRMMEREDVPPSWAEAELMVDKVRSASPLGADAFPELSRKLGLTDL